MGSFGKVFRGNWLCTDVAVKQIRRGASVSESIQREAMIHSRLRHPNIVTFMGVSIKKKDVLLVTEFVAGSSLQDIIDEEKEVEGIQGLVKDILKGVAYLHEVGVVHGDIKPANILVSPKLNVAKLCDFGLGRLRQHASMSLVVSQQVDAEPVLEGTPSYMAPEYLLNKKKPVQCSDIWSLGLTLLEFLTLDDAWDAVLKDIQAVSEVEKLVSARKSLLLPHTLVKLKPMPKYNISLCLNYNMADRPTALQLLKGEW